jgi:3-phenylpropionate/trans-cinnamate dioxygenase ferredoxin component
MSSYEDVAAVVDLEVGEMLGVTLANGEPVCVFNLDGDIGAVSDMCTHALFRLSDGVFHPDGTLECIWHGARFDCRTGAVKRHPAPAPLPVYDVRIEGDRVLVGAPVTLEEDRAS